MASFASSYIKTGAAAVTRNADVLTFVGTGNIVASTGTAYAEVSTAWTGNASETWARIVATSNSESGFNTPLGLKTNTAVFISDDDAELIQTSITSTYTGVRKVASSWSSAGMSVTGVGLTPASDASLAQGVNGTTIGIGAGTVGGLVLYGTLRNVRIYPRALSDAKLIAMTT